MVAAARLGSNLRPNLHEATRRCDHASNQSMPSMPSSLAGVACSPAFVMVVVAAFGVTRVATSARLATYAHISANGDVSLHEYRTLHSAVHDILPQPITIDLHGKISLSGPAFQSVSGIATNRNQSISTSHAEPSTSTSTQGIP